MFGSARNSRNEEVTVYMYNRLRKKYCELEHLGKLHKLKRFKYKTMVTAKIKTIYTFFYSE